MLALTFDPTRYRCDLALGPAGLVQGDPLEAAVWISLLSDRRADPDDDLGDPGPGGRPVDRRGWCGDALAEAAWGGPGAYRIGSRLWTLARVMASQQTARLAEDYAYEALDWLIADGVATAVAVRAQWLADGWLGLAIAIALPDGSRWERGLDLRRADAP